MAIATAAVAEFIYELVGEEKGVELEDSFTATVAIR